MCSNEGPAQPKINKMINKITKKCPITLRLNKKGKREKTCAKIAAAKRKEILRHCCCCSVAQSCPTLCDPMDCSTPGLPLLHQLPEFAQTHVHRVGDAIQPSHPLLSPFSCLQSFPASGSFPMSQLFTSGGQSVGVSASASVQLMNIQD